MRLKQLELYGFKTFANRTQFVFNEGITAIVGPNGCGKSNIADALRWVLGEQSPSALRSKKTEDLIFSGSVTRPRMGMAEVELTLENPFGLEGQTVAGSHADAHEHPREEAKPIPDWFSVSRRRPSDSSDGDGHEPRQRGSIVDEILRVRPSEVTLLRRAYRSGENEYLINRQRVRLRDLLELLQRWGLARLTYAVIGQGLVDQALSLRAEERRALFEEAAGIGLYQSKKQLALEKLEETQQNLLRVNDIINEIAPRLPSLARQADRATKYESVATALNEKLKQWYAYQWAHAQEVLAAALAAEEAAREKLNAQRAAMHDLTARLAEARRQAQTLRARLAEQRRVRQEREHALTARERELAILEERVRFTALQLADARLEFEAAEHAAQAAAAAFELFNATHAPLLDPSSSAQAESLAATEPDMETEWLARIESLAQAEKSAQAEFAAAEERLAQEEQLASAQAQQQVEEQTAFLTAQRERLEHERACALAKLRLAQARLAEFETQNQFPADASPYAATSDAASSPDLAQLLLAVQEHLPLYETALPAIARLAAHADELVRREQQERERQRLIERVRRELDAATTAFALADREVQAALQAETYAQRERERAEQERARQRERARRELAQERERIMRGLAQEREQIARERERLARARAKERERVQQMQAQEYERLARERERTHNERQSRAARVAALNAQWETLCAQRAARHEEVEHLRAALLDYVAGITSDELALEQSERLQNELEAQETNIRHELTVAEELYNQAVLEVERRRAEIARLEQEIEDDLGPVELDSNAPRRLRLRLVVRARATPAAGDESASESLDATEQELVTLPEVQWLPEGLDKEIRRLKNQMRYIGNVNPNAPQEYAELKQRHAFLTEQAADLKHAIEQLQRAMQELDAIMKQRFQETFDAINVEFKKYFSILFGGGVARLELTDPDDLIHSGVEIYARPPGKRASQLVLLSGGERALTATALLFAILKVSPTPFCVLDEVDAALDEANVGRFRQLLQEFAQETQFIVITHNRLTMEGARAVYGVSMGEDGVSQVFSLRLEKEKVS